MTPSLPDDLLALLLFGRHVAGEALGAQPRELAIVEARLTAWLRSEDAPTGVSRESVALVRDFVNVQVALAPEQAVVRARPDGVSSLQARVAQVNALSLRAGARHQRERLGETDS